MVKRRKRVRYGRGLRAAPVVAVVIGGAVSGCQSQNHVVHGVVAVTTTSTTTVAGVSPGSAAGGSAAP